MKAYSLDLREHVLAASQQPGRTLPQVAAQFSVSRSFVNKLCRRQRTSGSLAALPHAGGPAPLLDAAARQQVGECLRQQPDATLTELGQALVAAGGPLASAATLCRVVAGLDWRRKKRVSMPPSATASGRSPAPGLCGGGAGA